MYSSIQQIYLNTFFFFWQKHAYLHLMYVLICSWYHDKLSWNNSRSRIKWTNSDSFLQKNTLSNKIMNYIYSNNLDEFVIMLSGRRHKQN